ncbi:MAG: PAS domain S-box protein, partial [Pseudomonadota bacterium]|nr:PAS domain S-box protein [Pseudomonadota bacterium]
MTTGGRLPEETSRLSANDGTAQIALALDTACRDLAIPADVRQLLAEARDALRAASSDAETARLRYHALFDAVPDPVSILDERGIVLDLNKAGMVAYRRPREEIVGQSIEVLNPDLPKGHLGPVWDTINRGRTYVIEVTNMRADGTRFPVEVHSAGFQHDGRKCLVAVARDLSSRQEAELRYRELMEVIDKGIVVQDEFLNFTYGNSAALRLLGIDGSESLDDAMRLQHWMLVREDGTVMPEAEYPAMRAMREGRIIESTLVGLYHRQRRQLNWLSVTVVPQFAADADKPHQVLSMFSDVTELKRDSTLFDRVQALAHIGGWEWDATSDQLYLTDESARILAQDTP